MNERNGDIRVRLQPTKLPICEKEVKESLSNQENHNKRKLTQMQVKEGARFQARQAEELGSFSHVVLI